MSYKLTKKRKIIGHNSFFRQEEIALKLTPWQVEANQIKYHVGPYSNIQVHKRVCRSEKLGFIEYQSSNFVIFSNLFTL